MRRLSRGMMKVCAPDIILERLEDRIVLDAAVDQQLEDSSDKLTNTQSTEAYTIDGEDLLANSDWLKIGLSHIFEQDLHVLLVSNNLDQTEIVSASAPDGSLVVVYDPQTDNLSTLSAMLHNLVATTGQKIGALAFVDHGNDGVIKIGVDQITSENLFKFASTFAGLAEDLTADAQIEFFGCSIAYGTEGQDLLSQIASYTDAVVFASTDDTGGTHGWTLEYSSDPGIIPVTMIVIDEISQSDSVLIFQGYPPLDDLSTCYQYFSSLDTLDLRSVQTQYSYSETWTFTITTTMVVSIGMQTVHPTLNHGGTGFVDCWIDLYSGSTPNTANRITYNDDWVGPGTTNAPYWHGNDSLPVDAGSYGVLLTPGTYCIQATSWSDHNQPQYDLQTGGYYLLSNVELTYSGGHYIAPPTSDPIPDPPSRPENFTPAFTYDVHSYFSDPQGDTLMYQLGGITYSGGLQVGVSINSSTGVVTFTSVAGYNGSVSVQVRAYDGELYSPYETFVFTVTSPYNLPIANDDAITVATDDSITFKVIGYDPDSHPTNQVRFTILSGYDPSFGDIEAVDENGVATSPQYDAVGQYYYQVFTYTPDANYWGPDTFLFTLSTPGGTWRTFATGITIGQTLDSYNAYDVALVDLNANGTLDLLTANSNDASGQHNYYHINDTGSFRGGVSMELLSGQAATDSVGIATGDLNGDGFLDAVVRNGRSGTTTTTQADLIYLWDNAAQGFRVTQLPKTVAQMRGDIALGDFDGDGDLDIVRVFGTNIANEIFWNNGDGTFGATPSTLPATTGTSHTVATGDFNGDGYVDIFVGKSGNGQNHYVYFNDGYGTFTSANAKALPIDGRGRASDCAVGDVDGDGRLDIVVSRGTTSAGYGNYFYQNTGNNGSGYTNWTAVNMGGTYQSLGIDLADFDRDGDLDVVVANYNQNVRLYLYSSTGFTGSNIGTTTLNALSCAAGDVDNDGDIDVVVGINGAQNQIFYNRGFNSGTTNPWHQSAPAEVTIHVETISNWSFENSSPYSGWTLNETYSSPTPPEFILPEFSTFAIIENEPGGVTINYGDVLHDYYPRDNNDQAQFSLQLNSSIPGVPGVTVEWSESDHTALLLSGGLREASLTQTIDIPRDQYLVGLELHWNISYWNCMPWVAEGARFSSTQYVKLSLYDASTGLTTPLWVTTNGVDSSVVDSMQHYSVKLNASDPLVQKIASSGAQLVLMLEVCGLDWYLDVAVDDFKLVPRRHGPFGSTTLEPDYTMTALDESQLLSSAETGFYDDVIVAKTLLAFDTSYEGFYQSDSGSDTWTSSDQDDELLQSLPKRTTTVIA